ncbi:putative oxidoreductase/MSMEI_2347 [Mycobacterium basiliense]|uniref:Putative oxidoreductase/MSMEI_2347 n=1 Tax=Mycobacterium basiliense TaxID=2094119 RepID=A0A447GC43_9MYCO|nr:putative oxidoreductase/MSMEI_2347 [Mycobacterium basiliense]
MLTPGPSRTPSTRALIRSHIQLGNIVVPRSRTPKRIVSNFDVFDFERNAGELALTFLTSSISSLASITSLDHGPRLGPNRRTSISQAGEIR